MMGSHIVPDCNVDELIEDETWEHSKLGSRQAVGANTPLLLFLICDWQFFEPLT